MVKESGDLIFIFDFGGEREREREREREILVYDGIGDQVTKVCNLSCGRLAYIYWSSSCHGKSIQYFFKGKIKGYSKVIC